MPTYTYTDAFPGSAAGPLENHSTDQGDAWRGDPAWPAYQLIDAAGGVKQREGDGAVFYAPTLRATAGTPQRMQASLTLTAPATGESWLGTANPVFYLGPMTGDDSWRINVIWDKFASSYRAWCVLNGATVAYALIATPASVGVDINGTVITFTANGSTVYSGSWTAAVPAVPAHICVGRTVGGAVYLPSTYRILTYSCTVTTQEEGTSVGLGRDTGGSEGRSSVLVNGAAPIVVPLGVTARDTGGSAGRALVQDMSATRVCLEVYFAGAGTVAGQALAGVNYGTPTLFYIENPVVGREYILQAYAVDLEGWLPGVMGNNKLRRAGAGGNVSGPIVVRGIEFLFPEIESEV